MSLDAAMYAHLLADADVNGVVAGETSRFLEGTISETDVG